MSNNLTIVILNAEGDQFNASLIVGGRQGGVQACATLWSIAQQTLIGDSSLIVYLVAEGRKSFVMPDKTVEAFFEGFGSTEHCAFVVEPLESSNTIRIIQLLDFYLPLNSLTSLFLGSLHNQHLYEYLLNLPTCQKEKVTFISTVTVAPCYRRLAIDGGFKACHVFENLFGQLLTPDLAAKTVWDTADKDSFDLSTSVQAEETPSQELPKDECLPSNQASDRSEDDPIASKWRRSVLIWDDDSGDELFASYRPNQPSLSPPSSPQPSPLRSPELPVLTVQEVSTLVDQVVPFSAVVPDRSRIRARAPIEPLPTLPLSENIVGSSHLSPNSTRTVTTTSSNPLPIKPSSPSLVKGKGPVIVASSLSDVEETITETPQGLLSSLPTFPLPQLSFAAYTAPCKRFYLVSGGCPQTAQSCRFSHAFPFTPQEKELFPIWAKGTVCPDHARGKCKRGEGCYLGELLGRTL